MTSAECSTWSESEPQRRDNETFSQPWAGYRSIRRGLRKLAYDIKGMLALGGVRLARAEAG